MALYFDNNNIILTLLCYTRTFPCWGIMRKPASKLITIIVVLVSTLEASGDGGKNITINIIIRLEFMFMILLLSDLKYIIQF